MAEDPHIIRMNIAHYEAMLALPMEEKRRTLISGLLAEARLSLVDRSANDAASLRTTVEELRMISRQCREAVRKVPVLELKRLLAGAAFDIAQAAELLEIEIDRKR